LTSARGGQADRPPSVNPVFLSPGTLSGLDSLRFWTGMGALNISVDDLKKETRTVLV